MAFHKAQVLQHTEHVLNMAVEGEKKHITGLLSLTIDFQDKSSILAAACIVSDGHHVVAGVLQPQIRQDHGAVVVRLHAAAIVGSDVDEGAWPPDPDGAAH